MEEIFRISSGNSLNFSDNKFKITNKEDNKFKVTNKEDDKLIPVGEHIANYVTLSIDKFNNKFKSALNEQEFVFVSNAYNHMDSFSEAKNKIELFSYNFNDNRCFDCFTIDFISLIKGMEVYLRNLKNITSYVYDHGKLTFTSEYYSDSMTKLVRLEYKGNKLIEFSEYMKFGIKIVEYIHPIFSTWNIRIPGYAYSTSVILAMIDEGIKMSDIIVSGISELEKYVASNIKS